MKKLLILIVAIALYFHFYPNKEVNNWLLEKKDHILQGFSDATDTRVKLNAKKIYDELSNKFESFNQAEQEYLKEITQSRDSVIEFHQEYCVQKQRSPKFHTKNLELVCTTMSRYSGFF